MRLRQVVHAVGVVQLQIDDPSPIEADKPRAADKAAGAAQLVVVLRQDQVGARTIGAQKGGRDLGGLQARARQRQEAIQPRQLLGQPGMQVAPDARAQRLCPSQPGVGVLQLRRLGRNDRQRFGQEVEGLTPVQLVGQRRKYVQRLPSAAGQFHPHVEQRRRRGQGRSVARNPAQLRRQPQEGLARGSSGGQMRLQCGQVVAGRGERRGRWVVTAKRLETIQIRQCQPRRARRARSADSQPGQGGQEDEECQP